MTTGMIRHFCEAVLALKFLQKSMMLTPCCPSAGPTGGAGVASAAGICSLTYPVIFLAISLASLERESEIGNGESNHPVALCSDLALALPPRFPITDSRLQLLD